MNAPDVRIPIVVSLGPIQCEDEAEALRDYACRATAMHKLFEIKPRHVRKVRYFSSSQIPLVVPDGDGDVLSEPEESFIDDTLVPNYRGFDTTEVFYVVFADTCPVEPQEALRLFAARVWRLMELCRITGTGYEHEDHLWSDLEIRVRSGDRAFSDEYPSSEVEQILTELLRDDRATRCALFHEAESFTLDDIEEIRVETGYYGATDRRVSGWSVGG